MGFKPINWKGNKMKTFLTKSDHKYRRNVFIPKDKKENIYSSGGSEKTCVLCKEKFSAWSFMTTWMTDMSNKLSGLKYGTFDELLSKLKIINKEYRYNICTNCQNYLLGLSEIKLKVLNYMTTIEGYDINDKRKTINKHIYNWMRKKSNQQTLKQLERELLLEAI